MTAHRKVKTCPICIAELSYWVFKVRETDESIVATQCHAPSTNTQLHKSGHSPSTNPEESDGKGLALRILPVPKTSLQSSSEDAQRLKIGVRANNLRDAPDWETCRFGA